MRSPGLQYKELNKDIKMNRTILRADDMKVGQFVTILQGEFYQETVEAEMGVFFNQLTSKQTAGEENKQYNGMVLQIIAIDFPYIAVKDLNDSLQRFDLRDGWIFKVLSNSYVRGYKKELGEKK